MSLGRRGLLQVAAAVAALGGDAFAQRREPTQEDLLAFKATGQVTLLNFTDLHAQIVPIYFREPSANIGVGADRGLPPHIVGEKLLAAYKVGRNSVGAYALACADFEDLARTYGRLGGLDRLSTLIKAIRAERGNDKVLLLDGGDTWQGSYSALQTRGADMVKIINALKPDAMTGHWEFTYGQQRVQELIKQLEFPFLAGNVKDATWGDPVFQPSAVFQRGGLSIGVIGQAFPYTPIANPRYLVPDWEFGIDEDRIAANVEKLDKVLGRTEALLYRRGNFNGTFDDLICQALLAERDAEIALSPGFRWGSTLLPDQDITGDGLFNQTAITYPAAYRTEMTGAYLKQVLEDVADNLFNPDPYYQQGGDMVRAGGLAYTIAVDKPVGQRISDMTLLKTGQKIDAAKKYVVSGWASINEGTEGPPVYDVVARHIQRIQTVRLQPNRRVKVVVADDAGYLPG